jgi:ELWxxDGT repeat protein
VGNHLYLRANDGTSGSELWRTDGTTTSQVADINPGAGSSDPTQLAAISNSLVLFGAFEPTNGRELYRTNGTPAGTALVKNIAPGDGNSSPDFPTKLGNKLVFEADDNDMQSNNEPWVTDGTAAGTIKLREIAAPTNVGSFPNNFTEFGGRIYFSADDRQTGRELWSTDGTPAGTVQLGDSNPGGNDLVPSDFTPFAGTLFFLGTSETAGQELFKLGETPPALTLEAEAQALAKQLHTEVGCDERCAVTVTGKVKAKPKKRKKKGSGKKPLAKAKKFTLKAVTVEVDAGDTDTASPSFKNKDFKTAAKILKKGGKVTATLSATAIDGVGNQSAAKTAKAKLN